MNQIVPILGRAGLVAAGLFLGHLLPGLGSPGTAQAASFDCAKAARPVERMVCDDPKLSALDDMLARRFTALLALSLDPLVQRADEIEWLSRFRDKAADGAALAEVYAARIDQIEDALAALKRREAKRLTNAAEAQQRCPELWSEDELAGACTVKGFGTLPPVEGHGFAWGLYAQHDKEGAAPRRVRVVLFAAIEPVPGTSGGAAIALGPAGRLRALLAPFAEASFYAAPKLIRGVDRVLLELPGSIAGSGAFNDERLFVWRGAAWKPVDTTAWLEALSRRLPKGLSVHKGIYPDYRSLKATTPLWNAGDGSWCPSGGRAEITLAWQGDRLVLKDVAAKPAIRPPGGG